jgi:prepilin-type N-terminal cleavage/methylation domain-containing protein
MPKRQARSRAFSPGLRPGVSQPSRLCQLYPPAEPGAAIRRRRLYRGMTLIELLLVLALLVMIGSMVVPVFTGSFSSVRLRRAADQVLTRWSAARARAIETGEVMQFSFTPDTGTYVIEPWAGILPEEMTSATSATRASTRAVSTTATPLPGDGGATATTDSADNADKALPDQIVFYRGDIAVEDAMTGERRVDSMQASSDSQSTAILFFPDGTTSEASVVLNNDRRQYVRLTLRSLTGVGRATEVLTREELERASGG